MSTAPNPCPICDHPIADTAYVCHRCARSLATQLLRAARLWRDLEDSLAGQGATRAGRDGSRDHPRVRGEHNSCGPRDYGVTLRTVSRARVT